MFDAVRKIYKVARNSQCLSVFALFFVEISELTRIAIHFLCVFMLFVVACSLALAFFQLLLAKMIVTACDACVRRSVFFIKILIISWWRLSLAFCWLFHRLLYQTAIILLCVYFIIRHLKKWKWNRNWSRTIMLLLFVLNKRLVGPFICQGAHELLYRNLVRLLLLIKAVNNEKCFFFVRTPPSHAHTLRFLINVVPNLS